MFSAVLRKGHLKAQKWGHVSFLLKALSAFLYCVSTDIELLT